VSGQRPVALVSGGGRGIGRAVCLRLAADGFDVAVNYRRDADAAADTVAAAQGIGATARAYAAAVEDAEQDRVMVEAVVADFGRVDALVHCAGNASRGHDVVDTDPAEPLKLFAVHAAGGHHLCRLVVPHIRAQGGGSVVLISSIVSRDTRPGMAPYVMAKAAVDILGVTLAMEERPHRVRVNVIAPGLVATEMGDRLIRATQGRDQTSDLDAHAPFVGSAGPRTSPGWWASCSPTPEATSPGSAWRSTVARAGDGGGRRRTEPLAARTGRSNHE